MALQLLYFEKKLNGLGFYVPKMDGVHASNLKYIEVLIFYSVGIINT